MKKIIPPEIPIALDCAVLTYADSRQRRRRQRSRQMLRWLLPLGAVAALVLAILPFRDAGTPQIELARMSDWTTMEESALDLQQAIAAQAYYLAEL